MSRISTKNINFIIVVYETHKIQYHVVHRCKYKIQVKYIIYLQLLMFYCHNSFTYLEIK